jgi:hypothetical protein
MAFVPSSRCARVPGPVRIRVTRRFPFPRDAAYAWLTDFDDADAGRAGAVVEERRVLERGPRRVVYEGVTQVLGRRSLSTTEVALDPPARWRAVVTKGPRTGSETDYELVPTPDGCRLTVDYRFVLQDPKKHFVLRLAKPLVARDLGKMWDGFGAAMDRELRGAPARAAEKESPPRA